MTGAHAQFRRWLIDRLKTTRWTRQAGETIDELAVRLGVQPSVIEEAQRELDEARRAQGRSEIQLGHDSHSGAAHAYPEVAAPERVHADWIALCKVRQLSSAVLLRSLIWTLLSSPAQPEWLGRGWRYRGQELRLEGYQKGKRWPYVLKTEITSGAARALNMRARATHTTATALIRGQVLEFLEGRLKRVHLITSLSEMWEDETRYWTLDRRQSP